MPQMSPLMWLILFILFTALLMTTVLKNFFQMMQKTENKTMKTKTHSSSSISWKW